MDPIVLATDFSITAENAMRYAGHLAKTLKAPLILTNIYQIPIGMTDMPILMVSAVELKANAEIALSRSRELLQKEFGDLEIKIEARLGNTVDELTSLAKEEDAFILIVGSRKESSFERFLFGSTSVSLIKHAKCPVLVVPDDVSYREIKNVALAVDDASHGIHKEKIISLAKELNARLHVILVQTETTSLQELANIQLTPDYAIMRNDDFAKGILGYVKANDISMLAILPHKHSHLEKLIFKTHGAELMQQLSIPVLCINED